MPTGEPVPSRAVRDRRRSRHLAHRFGKHLQLLFELRGREVQRVDVSVRDRRGRPRVVVGRDLTTTAGGELFQHAAGAVVFGHLVGDEIRRRHTVTIANFLQPRELVRVFHRERLARGCVPLVVRLGIDPEKDVGLHHASRSWSESPKLTCQRDVSRKKSSST